MIEYTRTHHILDQGKRQDTDLVFCYLAVSVSRPGLKVAVGLICAGKILMLEVIHQFCIQANEDSDLLSDTLLVQQD